MAININGKTYRNLQQQVLQNMNDIEEIKEHGTGESYSAGTGINISDENVISIDNTVETKANATSRFVSKDNLTDYSINEIIVGNSQVDSDTVDLRAVYSQDVKSEVSLDPTSVIIRTMSGTDVSTIGISATEVDVTTPMFKYGTSEVATKADIPNYIGGFGIEITDNAIGVDNTVALKIDLPHLYQHNIVGMSSDKQDFVIFNFINTTSTAMTFGQVREWLYDNGFTGEINNEKHYLPATGRCSADSFEFDYTPQGQSTTSDYCESVVVGVRATSEDDNEIKALVSLLKEDASNTYEEDYISLSDSFTDTVVTLC